MLLRSEQHPAGYDYQGQFRDLQSAGGAECASFFVGYDGDMPILVVDESMVVELLGEELDAITVHRFSHRAARDLYLAAMLPRADFRIRAQNRQACFRSSLSPAAQAIGDHTSTRHPYILPPGSEDENLYPTLRGEQDARRYFAERGITWWRGQTSGDSKGVAGPTRNMTSSQIACVNLFLPFRDQPQVLAAMLRAIDPTIVDVASVPYTTPQGLEAASLVELEWTGRVGTLEGSGTRGARATSADACLIGLAATGERRLFLIECKYTEQYSEQGSWKGGGTSGEARLRRYGKRYAASTSCFNGSAPLSEVLYEPFYQLVRLGMLADAALADGPMNLDAATVVVICPEDNTAYRQTMTSPPLAARFPEATTVEQIAGSLWRDPKEIIFVEPRMLVAEARQSFPSAAEAWANYLDCRYDW